MSLKKTPSLASSSMIVFDQQRLGWTRDCTFERKENLCNRKLLSQYLELRFSVGVRMVGCLFFILEYVSNFLLFFMLLTSSVECHWHEIFAYSNSCDFFHYPQIMSFRAKIFPSKVYSTDVHTNITSRILIPLI